MAVLAPQIFDQAYISWADLSRHIIAKQIGRDGIVAPAVKPTTHKSNIPYTIGSPEGQAFVTMLYAAHRDCIEEGKCI